MFGRIGVSNAAAISDMALNGFLDRGPSPKKDHDNSSRGFFHSLPKELQTTAVMAANKQVLATRQANSHTLVL